MKMKACNVKPHGYIYLDHGKDTKNEFNVGDHIRVSEYIFFVKSYQHNCAKEVFVITNVDDSIPWTYVVEEISRVNLTLQLEKQ